MFQGKNNRNTVFWHLRSRPMVYNGPRAVKHMVGIKIFRGIERMACFFHWLKGYDPHAPRDLSGPY